MKQFKCSMSKKKESLAKKSEADYGAMTWTVTVEFDDNGKSVRKDYVVKAHNRESAIDQAKLKPQHTNPDAKNIKVTYCKLGESLTKMQEMHPMFKNWNPRNQAQVNNTLRLAMAECPQDMPELIEIVKAKGFNVPSGLTPATGWGSFESKSERQYKNCSMAKKKESLVKRQERIGYADNDIRLNGYDLAFVVTSVTTDDRGYDLALSVKEGETYTLDELGSEINGMCENCNGESTVIAEYPYPGNSIRILIQAPIENDDGELTDDYWDAIIIKGYIQVVGDKLNDIASYLEDTRS